MFQIYLLHDLLARTKLPLDEFSLSLSLSLSFAPGCPEGPAELCYQICAPAAQTGLRDSEPWTARGSRRVAPDEAADPVHAVGAPLE